MLNLAQCEIDIIFALNLLFLELMIVTVASLHHELSNWLRGTLHW